MKRKDKVKVTRPWKDDPDMGDMEDPEYREEIFSSLQYDGIPPEHRMRPRNYRVDKGGGLTYRRAAAQAAGVSPASR